MRRIFIFATTLIASLFISCNRNDFNDELPDGYGYLSMDGTSIFVDNNVEITKSTVPADGNYAIRISNVKGEIVLNTTYAAIKSDWEAGKKLSMPAGEYRFTACSINGEIPEAEFEHPVYGAEKSFTIVAGQATNLGTITCRLLQTKVTISYSNDFLDMVRGNCTASVAISQSSPLKYELSYNGGNPSYNQSAGYFKVNNGEQTTMEVNFKGLMEDGEKTMNQTFTNIKPCTWHQIKFIKKVNQEGTADVVIEISELINDVELKNNVAATEAIIGDDPKAPKGDGGIKLESCCAFDITQPIVVPAKPEEFILKMKATIPNKVEKFTVEISSTNEDFVGAVKMVNNGSATLDLVNPSSGAIEIFTTIIPFPYGNNVYGKDLIEFDLSSAQDPIRLYKGDHTFTMNVMDKTGCKKTERIIMRVQ